MVRYRFGRLINDGDVSRAKLNMFDWVLETGFHLWSSNARLEKWCEALNAMDDCRDFLPLFDETIGRSCAKRPSPEKHLVALVDQGKILTVTAHNLINVHILKLIHRQEVYESLVAIVDTELTLNVHSA